MKIDKKDVKVYKKTKDNLSLNYQKRLHLLTRWIMTLEWTNPETGDTYTSPIHEDEGKGLERLENEAFDSFIIVMADELKTNIEIS